jgi:hypothetical protein
MIFNLFKRKKALDERIEKALEIDGHTLYVFKSIDHMPKFREMSLRLAFHQQELGVKHSDLQAFVELAKEAFNKGDMMNLGTLINTLALQLDNYASERIMMELGGCGILVDDEPVDRFQGKHNKIKEELLRHHPEVRAFFLNTALNYLHSLIDNFQSLEIKDYLKNPLRIKREATFLRLIGTNIYQDLGKDSMQKSSGSQSD